MPREQNGNRNSELWISLDETVKRTGVSKRNILEWVSAGLIKKEKKKGMVYLWVADLVKQTPLSTVEPQEIHTTTEIIAPEVEPITGQFAPIRHLGEQIQQSLDGQTQILSCLNDIQEHLKQDSPTPQHLDEKTIKELSLLGSVFRSLHQQNEKISESLERQDNTIRQINLNAANQRDLEDKVSQAQSKAGRITIVTSTVIILLILGSALIIYNINSKKNDTEISLSTKTTELRKNQETLNEKNNTIEDKIKQINDQKKLWDRDLAHHLDSKNKWEEEKKSLQSEKTNLQNEKKLAEEKQLKKVQNLIDQHQKEIERLQKEKSNALELNKTLQNILKKQNDLEESLKTVDDKIKKIPTPRDPFSGNLVSP